MATAHAPGSIHPVLEQNVLLLLDPADVLILDLTFPLLLRQQSDCLHRQPRKSATGPVPPRNQSSHTRWLGASDCICLKGHANSAFQNIGHFSSPVGECRRVYSSKRSIHGTHRWIVPLGHLARHTPS